jgi:hypothetical protein
MSTIRASEKTTVIRADAAEEMSSQPTRAEKDFPCDQHRCKSIKSYETAA